LRQCEETHAELEDSKILSKTVVIGQDVRTKMRLPGRDVKSLIEVDDPDINTIVNGRYTGFVDLDTGKATITSQPLSDIIKANSRSKNVVVPISKATKIKATEVTTGHSNSTVVTYSQNRKENARIAKQVESEQKTSRRMRQRKRRHDRSRDLKEAEWIEVAPIVYDNVSDVIPQHDVDELSDVVELAPPDTNVTTSVALPLGPLHPIVEEFENSISSGETKTDVVELAPPVDVPPYSYDDSWRSLLEPFVKRQFSWERQNYEFTRSDEAYIKNQLKRAGPQWTAYESEKILREAYIFKKLHPEITRSLRDIARNVYRIVNGIKTDRARLSKWKMGYRKPRRAVVRTESANPVVSVAQVNLGQRSSVYYHRERYASPRHRVVNSESAFEITDFLVDMLSPFGDKRELRPYMPYITCLIQIYRSRGAIDVYAALLALNNSLRINISFNSRGMLQQCQFIWELLSCVAKEYWVRAEASLSEVLNMGKEFFDRIVTSSLFVAIRNVIMSVLSWHVFDKDIAKHVYSVIGKPDKKISIADSVLLLFESLMNFIKVGERIYNGMPIKAALMEGSNSDLLMRNYGELLRYKDMLYSGVPEAGKKDVREYVRECNDYLGMAEVELKVCPPANRFYLTKAVTEISTIKYSLECKLRAQVRSAPLGIIFEGPPGIGKSNILMFTAALHAEVRGRKFDPSYIYHRTLHSEYWEQYEPFSHPYIHYGEVGSETPQRAQTQPDTILSEILSVIDDIPMPVNMAFGEKNKVFAYPELVLIDTNNPSLNADKIKMNPAAVYRRFIFVRATVKQDYTDGESGRLDPDKSLQDPEFIHDRWLFDVYVRKPTSNNTWVDERIFGSSSIDIFTYSDKFREFFLERISRNERFESIPDKYNMEKYTEAARAAYVASKNKQDALVAEYILAQSKWIDADGSARSLDEMHNDRQIERGYLSSDSEHSDLDVEAFSDGSDGPFVGIHDTSDILDEKHTLECVLSSGKKCICRQVNAEMGFETLYFSIIAWSAWYFIISSAYNRWRVGDARLYDVWLAVKTPFVIAWRYKAPNFLKTFTSCCGDFYEYVKRWFLSRFIRFTFGKEYVLSRYADRTKYEEMYWWKKFVSNIYSVSSDDLSMLKGGVTALMFGASLYQAYDIIKVFFTAKNFILAGAQSSMTEIEKEIGVLPGRKRVPNKIDSTIWNVQVPLEKKSAFTGALPELYDRIMRNVRVCRIHYSDDRVGNTHVIGLFSNFAVVNSHALHEAVKIGTGQGNGSFRYTTLTPELITDLGDDISVVSLASDRFSDIRPHLFDGDYTARNYNAFAFGGDVSIHAVSGVTFKSATGFSNFSLEKCWEYRCRDHGPGRCGNPIVADINGPVLVGFHSGGLDGHGYGSMFCNLRTKLRNLNTIFTPVNSVVHANIDVRDPHPKSCFRYVDAGAVSYFGNDGRGTMVKSKSRLVKTGFGPDVFDTLSRLCSAMPWYQGESILPGEPWARPIMMAVNRDGEYISPYNVALAKIGREKCSLDQVVLKGCVDEYLNHVLPQLGGVQIHPIPSSEAINGVTGDPFTRPMNFNTSAAYGYKGKKRDYFIGEPGSRLMNQELQDEVISLLQRYANGESGHIIYKAQLKDEARPVSKVAQGKTRLFYMSPMAFLVVCRMFLSPVYTLMVEKSRSFCTAVGINAHTAGDYIHDIMTSLSPNIMEGDYSNFDQSMPVEIAMASNDFIYRLCERLGYEPSSLQILRGILTDLQFPTVAMLDDLFEVPGLQPSGMYGTAENNSIRGVLLLMYAFRYLVGEESFFQNVVPLTYGDDVLANVSEQVSEKYNNLTYSEFSAERYGMPFTPAVKNNVLTKFMNIRTCSFIKRKIVYRSDECRNVMALDINSIVRSLQWYIPSDSVSVVVQFEGTVRSALWEAALHLNRDAHTEFADSLRCVTAPIFGDNKIDLPTYDQIWSSWSDRSSSDDVDCESSIYTSPQWFDDPNAAEYYGIANVLEMNYQAVFSEPEGEVTLYTLRAFYTNQLSICKDTLEMDRGGFASMREVDIRKAILRSESYAFRTAGNLRLKYLERRKYLVQSLESIDGILQNRIVTSESAVFGEQRSGIPVSVDSEQNLTEVMGEDSLTTMIGRTERPSLGQDSVVDISKFLSRPVRLYEDELKLGYNAPIILSIWDLFTRAPSVRSKLRNFAYLRANMKVRISISGSPFHYGRFLVSYQPLAVYNDVLINISANAAADAGFRPLFYNYLSQSRGSSTMVVNQNRPLDIDIPFIANKPMFRLFDTSSGAITAGTGFPDLVEAGDLYIVDLNNVGAVSTTPTNLYIQVFAWMTDVELGCPTSTQLVVNTESGISDERKTGPVERFASRAAEVSAALTRIPTIGVFARASQIAFSGLSSISALFGWSKPVMIDSPVYVKNEPYQNGALTVGYDTVQRIVLDPKQELTVDPRLAGSDEDEMCIRHMTARSTFFRTFQWAPTNPVMGSPIFTTRVNPNICTQYVTGGQRYVQPTALAFASAPFQYWRGDIIFRFEIVCSNFHRGKIAIYYEPNLNPGVITSTDIAYNKQFLHIVDIQQTQSFELKVDWTTYREWLLVGPPDACKYNEVGVFDPTYRNGYSNGYIGVTPFTKLQSPDGSTIDINVYVRSDNMMFNFLTANNIPTERRLPVVVNAESSISSTVTNSNGTYFAEPVEQSVLNPSTAIVDHCAEHHFGEIPISFRALVRRYVTLRAINTPDNYSDIPCFLRIFVKNVPDWGLDYGNVGWTVVPNLLSYLSPSYLGMRGSFRYRAHLNGFYEVGGGYMNSNPQHQVRISNHPASSSFSESVQILYFPNYAAARLEGTVCYAPWTNAGVEYEVPFYTNNYFLYSFRRSRQGGVSSNNMEGTYVRGHVVEVEKANSPPQSLVLDVAAGEDFSFLRFVGAPSYSVPV
jgi:hypothetical protein